MRAYKIFRCGEEVFMLDCNLFYGSATSHTSTQDQQAAGVTSTNAAEGLQMHSISLVFMYVHINT